MQLCDYGCGEEGKHQLRNGKWCCSKSFNSCPSIKKKNSIKMKKLRKDPNSKYNSIEYKKNHSNSMKKAWKDPNNIFNSNKYKEKLSNIKKEEHKNLNSNYNSNSCKQKIINGIKKAWKDPNSKYNSISYKNKQKLNIKKINKRYPFFSKIEEMRYDPKKAKEIQVHCKNHKCENSKEKEGWFTPTYIQLYERIRQLESKEASGGCYFYCCQECKNTCPLYHIHGDPFKDNNLPYTASEYQTFRTFVLERDAYVCQFCGKKATDVHHERPQKLEPFFSLDPDFAWSCCGKCHYEKGHQDECSTGNLAKIVCSVESQKFLNQKGE